LDSARDEVKDTKEAKQNETNPACCSCPKKEEDIKVVEREREMHIAFEDFLQYVVYSKR
jgi:hypothetical protein